MLTLGTGSGNDNVALVQSFAKLGAGSNYYLSFDQVITISGSSNIAPTSSSCSTEVFFSAQSSPSSLESTGRVYSTYPYSTPGSTKRRVNIGGLIPIDAMSVAIYYGCSGSYTHTVSLDNLTLSLMTGSPSDGSVFTARSAVINPSFNDNADCSISPWIFSGTDQESGSAASPNWSTTTSLNSITMSYSGQSAGYVNGVLSQVISLKQGQTFALAATLVIDTTGSGDGLTCAAYTNFSGNTASWQPLDERGSTTIIRGQQQKSFDIVLTNQLRQGNSNKFTVTVACSAGGTQRVRATLSDLSVNVNVPGI